MKKSFITSRPGCRDLIPFGFVVVINIAVFNVFFFYICKMFNFVR